MKIEAVLVLAAVQLAAGVIHRLNDSEYARLPPLFRLDDYNSCLRKPGDTFCYVDAQLVANGTNELFTFVQEYSANKLTHYDHTQIHWGMCVTQTCRQYLSNTTDLRVGIEACLNATLTETLQLQAKVIQNRTYCTEFGETIDFDTSDYAVGAVFITLALLNIFGSIYHLYLSDGSKSFVGRFLLCFSVKNNWRRLVAPSGEGPEPKLRRLKCFNGIKAMTTLLVILGHSCLITLIMIDNPQYQENTYHVALFQVLYNGTLIVQTFFLISGFLLAYNLLVISEKRPVSWTMLPLGTLLRWLRLTPMYAVVVAFISTWLRHLHSGPLWKPVVDIEVLNCRRDWWYHLLYFDNYVDLSQCMPQTWYLSCDMQLSIVGLMIFCLLKSAKARKIAIGITFVIGLITPAAHTFFQNLHPVLIVSPEMARRYFVEDLTFNNLYKRGHTNIVCYALGLALGMALYNLQGKEDSWTKYKKFRNFYRTALILPIPMMICGMVFYADGIEIPLAVRVPYSSAVKLIFGVCISICIAGTILQVERVCRATLEWRGWTALARVSYCAYLLHVVVIRTSASYYTALQHTTLYRITLQYFSIVGMTYMLAVPCWMLVEAPMTLLVKLCFEKKISKDEEERQLKSTKSSSSTL